MRSFIILATAVSSAFAAVTRTGGTVVLADTRGAQGNECITFRNNGEQTFPSVAQGSANLF